MSDLRDHLFMTLEGLNDKDEPMDIKRAEAIANVAQVLVNIAKVEVDFVKATHTNGSSFFEANPTQPQIK
jgi:hypothetical protein